MLLLLTPSPPKKKIYIYIYKRMIVYEYWKWIHIYIYICDNIWTWLNILWNQSHQFIRTFPMQSSFWPVDMRDHASLASPGTGTCAQFLSWMAMWFCRAIYHLVMTLLVCHGKIHHAIKNGKPSITGPSIPWQSHNQRVFALDSSFVVMRLTGNFYKMFKNKTWN